MYKVIMPEGWGEKILTKPEKKKTAKEEKQKLVDLKESSVETKRKERGEGGQKEAQAMKEETARPSQKRQLRRLAPKGMPPESGRTPRPKYWVKRHDGRVSVIDGDEDEPPNKPGDALCYDKLRGCWIKSLSSGKIGNQVGKNYVNEIAYNKNPDEQNEGGMGGGMGGIGGIGGMGGMGGRGGRGGGMHGTGSSGHASYSG